MPRADGGKRVVAVADEPAEQADGVGFEDGRAAIEGDGDNRAGRIAADAGQLLQLRDLLRELAAVARDKLLGRGVELASTPIVTQPLPQAEHLPLVGCGKGMHVGQCADEPREILADRRHLRLLQHDLADPHAIGIAGAPPGQIAGVRAVPCQ